MLFVIHLDEFGKAQHDVSWKDNDSKEGETCGK